MRCGICGDELSSVHDNCRHLVLTKNMDDKHVHVHGDLIRDDDSADMIECAIETIGLDRVSDSKLDIKEVVFHNRQRIGDILMFTCGVRDFKQAFPHVRVNVISTAEHIWDHNPYVDRTLAANDKNTVKIGPGKLTNSSNRLDWHFANAYRVSIEENLGVKIPQGESRPDIWFTKDEYNEPRLFEQPYWVICLTGEKSWGCKMYPFDRWQAFVSANPNVTFVQIGTREDNPPRLQGDNIIDYVGKTQDRNTGIRDIFKLFLNAEGSIGLVSFHMHLSGALYKPCIVVAGAREPVSFTRYPGHQYLATDGCLPCSLNACWHCDIDKCRDLVTTSGEKVPRCVDIIDPADLCTALHRYYRGGRLSFDKPSEKPRLNNIVNAPTVVVASDMPSKVSTMGLGWGGKEIREDDWAFIKHTIEIKNIKTVLEFGAGLSTLLLADLGLKVVSFTTEDKRIEQIKKLNPSLDIRKWDGVNEGIIDPRDTTDLCRCSFDMAFVDGPPGGKNREVATKLASIYAGVVIIHDAHREHETKWQKMYLEGDFNGPIKGGHRCHLWDSESESAEVESAEETKTFARRVGKKYIKIVSTARGWGGCARSITTIMKFLLQEGHIVEFIPFRNSIGSREFNEYIRTYTPDLKVTTTYDSIGAPCDVLFVYADDYIWEFGSTPMRKAFDNIQADRKIMMLNYRKGPVGNLEWTQGWDKYMFLNSTQETELLQLLPGVKTKVLPPCTELEEFFKVEPDFSGNVMVVRHNSQGDTKFPKDIGDYINMILERKDLQMMMMPGPSFVNGDGARFIKCPRNNPPIPEFLALGNLFWYALPDGYMDMGPRVVLEAMASGLPIIADNWGGVVDRVTPECGWLCGSKGEQVEIIKNVPMLELRRKGEAARERAMSEFAPEKWIKEIVD